MVKVNRESETEAAALDLEHELPPGEGDDRPATIDKDNPPAVAENLGTELQRVKAERDLLLAEINGRSLEGAPRHHERVQLPAARLLRLAVRPGQRPRRGCLDTPLNYQL